MGATAQDQVTEDRLGFLLARHGQVMNTRLRQALTVSGLGPRHCAVLFRLSGSGPTSQQALLEAMALDPSTLVSILNDLERSGMLQRRRDPADRRRHIVEITTAGADTIAQTGTAIARVEAEAFADLDPAEVEQLHALLARVRTRADAGPCPSTEACPGPAPTDCEGD